MLRPLERTRQHRQAWRPRDNSAGSRGIPYDFAPDLQVDDGMVELDGEGPSEGRGRLARRLASSRARHRRREGRGDRGGHGARSRPCRGGGGRRRPRRPPRQHSRPPRAPSVPLNTRSEPPRTRWPRRRSWRPVRRATNCGRASRSIRPRPPRRRRATRSMTPSNERATRIGPRRPVWSSASTPPDKGADQLVAGGMFWFPWNTLSGSYRALIRARRSQVLPGYAARTRASPSSPTKFT